MNWFLWLVEGPLDWLRRRNWRLMLQGMPAVVVAVAFVAAVNAGMGGPDRGLEYLNQAQSANRTGSATAALAHAEAAVRLRPDDPAAKLELAVAALGTGHSERSLALLNSLAPLDRRGYGPAHLMLARGLLTDIRPGSDAIRAAEIHLARADDSLDVAKDEVNLLLGEVYLLTGRVAEAKVRLAKADNLMPARLRLGQIAAAEGNEEAAQTAGEMCREFFAARLTFSPTNVMFRTLLIESLLLKADYQQALSIVADGLTLTPDDANLRALRGNVYSQWITRLDRDPASRPELKLAVLEQGLLAEPANTALLLRLWAFAEEKGPKAVEGRELLRKRLAVGQNVAVTHFILGTSAWQEGDPQKATMHLEQAYAAAPRFPVIGNNLAWILADKSPPQLDRALDIINVVLMNSPGNPRYRGTRGYVLAKLGKWKDALTDLEYSLNRPDVEAETHELLAECYRKLGDTKMAEEHVKLSKSRPRVSVKR